ncbi:RNA polymerase II transcription factor B 52 kDa subunit [Irineochytrium annulatum]|nr:RNA polymerase II transcription factor B 52 kDa subunit [Irineochytrium annulatum]
MADMPQSVCLMIENYIQNLPKKTFSRLYEQPATCLAILRLLPPLAKHIAFRLLYSKSPVSKQDLEAWCHDGHAAALQDSLKRLAKFNVCLEDRQGFYINPVFQQNMHHALVGGFYPTRLATSLTSGSPVTTKISETHGYIILETNFKVYAYTCFLYQEFPRMQDYKDLKDYAAQYGYVTWFSDEKKMFVVSKEGHQRVREHYKKKTGEGANGT